MTGQWPASTNASTGACATGQPGARSTATPGAAEPRSAADVDLAGACGATAADGADVVLADPHVHSTCVAGVHRERRQPRHAVLGTRAQPAGPEDLPGAVADQHLAGRSLRRDGHPA